MSPARIVLVDDDRTNANLIKILLEMDGFRVVICPDIGRAVQEMDDAVGALIIDCNLSRGDSGIDLLRSIRSGQTAARANVPVIMTSGDDRCGDQAIQAGATQFLLKPYSPSRLTTELLKLFPQE